MTRFNGACYNGVVMKKDNKTRNCVLVVKVTTEEKEKITKFAAEQSVNVSALVRRLLLDQIQRGSPQVIK